MRSIALRLWTYIIILILVILGVLWFLQTGVVNSFYVNWQTDNIKRSVKEFTMLKHPDDINRLDKSAEAISNTYNAIVDIIDVNGKIVTTQGRMMRGRVLNIEAAEFKNVLSGQERIVNEEHAMTGMQLVSVGMPIKYGEAIIGALFVHIPSSSMKDTVYVLQRQFLIILIISILAATLGAFIISKRFTSPILKINNAAVQISKGEFDTRVDINYKDEIGRLGSTINYMASELSKVENLRRDLIANISHEFRTPLGIIKSYGEGLLDNVYRDDKEKEEFIRIILDETSRLSQLVNDILELSKLQSGNISIEISSFNLSSLMIRTVDKFKALYRQKGLDIILKGSANVNALGDEVRIEQVMINLMNNALNYTNTGGKIYINILDDNDILIEVCDTGVGIPKEELPYIFDRFYKVDRTGKKDPSGTGLGLAIVKEILKGHNSSFGVESDLGKGTKFYFSLRKA